jgi:hypothetical protein
MNAPELRWPLVSTPAANFIGNRWLEASSAATLPMIDPSDGEPFAAIARSDARDVDAAVRAARGALEGSWGALAPAERGRLLFGLARAIADRADELAMLEARDCGKPLSRLAPTSPPVRATSNSTAAPPTSCTARPFPFRATIPCSPGASRTA